MDLTCFVDIIWKGSFCWHHLKGVVYFEICSLKPSSTLLLLRFVRVIWILSGKCQGILMTPVAMNPVMCHHELCPTLVSDPVQLSYTEAAPWLYKKMVYDYSARKTSPGIVTLVPCHLMVAINHAKQGISRFYPLIPYLGRSFHWLSLNDKVPRQLSYGVIVPELYEKR